MKDLVSILHSLRRPRLLIRAARFGAGEYRRDTHLPRILGTPGTPRSGPALMRLMELEAEMDDRRRGEDATYSVARHVELLMAMMGEAHILAAKRA